MKAAGIITAIIVGSGLIATAFLASSYLSEDTVEITVQDKERVVDRDGSGSRYLIWGEDEVYQNVDSLIKGKFNSSDLYGQLEKDKTYTCKVYGFRNGFFSMYKNIIKCKEKVNE